MPTIQPEPTTALRALRFPLVLLVIEFLAIAFAASFGSVIARRVLYVKDSPLDTLGAVLVAAAAVGAYVALCHALEGRRDGGEYALGGAGKELGAGLLFGFLLFSAMTGIVAMLGGFAITGSRWPGELWAMLAMAVVSGFTEETLFRGVLFRHVEAMLGSWAALAITSALFGVAHIFNPNATWFSSLAIAFEAGLLLGGAYMLTRRLWLAIGIHAAWNFTQGWVFSVPVSGGRAPLGLFASRRVGPDWLTGGSFGLEASAVAMIAATLAGVVLVWIAVRRGRAVQPMWRRAAVGQTKL